MKNKKPSRKEVLKAMEVLNIHREDEIGNFFRCKCPKALSSGLDGFCHRTPIDCVITPSQIKTAAKYRIKDLECRIKELKKLI